MPYETPKKILYFIKSHTPTEKEHKAARKLDGDVSYRNANHVPPDGALEACDLVAGSVPARYFAAYDHASGAALFGKDEVSESKIKKADETGELELDDEDEDEDDDKVNAGEAVGKTVSGQLTTEDGFSTPAATDPKLQAKAVAAGKALPQVDTDEPSPGMLATETPQTQQEIDAKAAKAAKGKSEAKEDKAAGSWTSNPA